jgi:hypothetical protein
LKVGDWSGKVTFLAVTLDDFDIILGNMYFVLAKAVPMHFLGGLLIMDEKQPYFVRAIKRELLTGGSSKKKGILLAMQLKDGLRMGDVTYLAALREVKEKDSTEFQRRWWSCWRNLKISCLQSCLTIFHPRRPVDHKIEPLPGSTPPARVPYRMSPKELVELQK